MGEFIMVNLPWPDKILNPNARPHHMAKANVKKAERLMAKYLTMEALFGLEISDEPIRAEWKFYVPDRRRRDLGNMRAAMKSALDGVFDALGVDDSLICEESLHKCKVIRGGRVHLRLYHDVDNQQDK